MKKVITINAKWNRKRKTGTYNFHCDEKWGNDARIEKTTPDDLYLLAMTAAAKEMGKPGDELHFYVKNSRVRNAISHPSTSIHGESGRLFKSTVQSMRCTYRIHS